MENTQENLIQDTANPEKVGKGFDVEIPSDEAKKITEELSKINDLISHDGIIKIEDLDKLSSVAKETKIDVGGEIMTVEEAEKIPDLKMNVEIWKEIEEGKLDRTHALTFTVPRIENLLNKKISDEIKNGNKRHLQFLTSLDVKTAEILGESHKEGEKTTTYNLYLYGLKFISDTVAEKLSKFSGNDLVLNNLTSCSDVALEYLAKFSGRKIYGGDLYLGITDLSDSGAESLSKFKGILHLSKLKNISDKAASFLAKRHHSALYIQDVRVSEKIAKFKK